MRRYDHVLPDWTRIVYASQRAKDVWAPRISRIGDAWTNVERASVPYLRDAALIYVAREQLGEVGLEAARRGLALVPVSRQAHSRSYSSTGRSPQSGEPWMWRYVLGRPETAAAFAEADDVEAGQLLGYPGCCREFFQHYWVDEGFVDTTWPMAGDPEEDTCVRVEPDDAPWASNILLRWIGVRPVPHLPCSFDCGETRKDAEGLFSLMEELGYAEEAGWAREMLSWPVRWSALHGIGVIKTPILKISARTDATPIEYRVDKGGTEYPEEGAYGNDFPYRSREDFVQLTGTKSYRRAFEDASEWEDNGFATKEGMDAAHEAVLEGVRAAELPAGRVLDLGCGNGKLAARACRDDQTPVGVDLNSAAIQRARRDYPEGRWIEARIQDVDCWEGEGPFAGIILMPGRLLEMDEDSRAAVIEALRRSGAVVVVYLYDDVARTASLAEVCSRAGIGEVENTTMGAATVGTLRARPIPAEAGMEE